jgi:hypothetical protein
MSTTRQEIAGLLGAAGGVAGSVVADTEAVVFLKLARGEEAAHLFPVISNSWSASTVLNIASELTAGNYRRTFWKSLYVLPTLAAQYAVYLCEGNPTLAATVFMSAVSSNYLLTTLEQIYTINEQMKKKNEASKEHQDVVIQHKASYQQADQAFFYDDEKNPKEAYQQTDSVSVPINNSAPNDSVDWMATFTEANVKKQKADKAANTELNVTAAELGISTAKAGSIIGALAMGGPGKILELANKVVPIQNAAIAYAASGTSAALGLFSGVKNLAKGVRHVKNLWNIAYPKSEDRQPLVINSDAPRNGKGG